MAVAEVRRARPRKRYCSSFRVVARREDVYLKTRVSISWERGKGGGKGVDDSQVSSLSLGGSHEPHLKSHIF